MGGMTKLALGATITVALIFALFLILFLLLLVDFVTSLVKTRKDNPNQKHDLESPNPKSQQTSKPTILSSFYAHGVLQAPTSFLLTVPNLEAAAAPPIKPTSSSPVSVCSLSGSERFVCISNPVYDGVQVEVHHESSTPFETPGTSPSHFGEEEEWSPPLGFMKKLQPVRQWHHGSVYANDANQTSSCSFSSNTHCFSPSW